MTSEPTAGGIRVSIRTSSPRTVARYVMGLGENAVPEHEVLRKLVRRLALEALGSCDEAEREALERGDRLEPDRPLS
jgi:hypothetical protein